MKHDRLLKAQSICQKLISEYFQESLESDDLLAHGIITVTDVKISQELSYLDIYVSALKGEDLLTKTLAKYADEIQRLLGKKIEFIKVPKVRFRYDASGKESFEIYSAIEEVSQ